VVVALLAEKRKTLATAESVTAGLVGHRLGQVAGASHWFRGGIVAYVNELKTALLGVPPQLLEQHGAVSAEVAQAMAQGCRTRLQSDLAVSTTGIAGPTGGTAEKPVGLVHVGLAWDGGSKAVSYSWSGTRYEIQSRTAKLALNEVRLYLLGT
jgi:nicotinamide-nucleotide amidase